MSSAEVFSTSTPSTSATTPTYPASPTFASEDDDEDTLPYPNELPRSDFLKPDFDPQEYLSSLRNRHQTLEDLRSDLRGRSQLLNRELLDLVNGHYEEFLSLGSDLKDGEDKVEGVRVGLLGFKREIEGLQAVVAGREEEVDQLLTERKGIRREVALGRKLLEISENIESLEEALGIKEREAVDDGEDDGLDDEYEEDKDANGKFNTIQTRRLERQTEQYLLISHQVEHAGSSHPFLVAQRPRLDEIRRTLLLDLSAALRQAKGAREPRVLLELSNIFGDLGAESEALKVLKAG